MDGAETNYLESSKKLFRYYKTLGDAVIERLDDDALNWRANETANSIATIIKHIAGNSLSRWTDFLTTDGEKQWRNRDAEFEQETLSKQQLHNIWEKGWQCLFNAIDPLTATHLEQIVYIRNEGHTVLEAINRQLAHLPYHVGQMVFAAKILKGDSWQSLSIPKGNSSAYNQNKFSAKKKKGFFTDDV